MKNLKARIKQHKPLHNRSVMTPSEVVGFMERQKLTAEMLAEAIGVTNSAVRHWINGTRSVPEVEVRVIRLFDADPRFIPYFKTLGGAR